ncbi:MAG: hypothetical protein ACI4PM_07565 [Butyricicoccus sp.]
MERFKQILNRILFPGIAVVRISMPVAAALLVYTFLYEDEYSPIAYISYIASAYSLIIVCAAVIQMPKGRLRAVLHKNPYMHRYLTDIPFKVHVSLYVSLGINLLFAVMNLFYGIRYRSAWYGTLGVYYSMLAGMRFLLLRYANQNGIGKDLVSEWKNYRLCGIILLLMNIALLGVVVLVVLDNEGFSYEGYLIYVVAMYAFYNIITAVKDMIWYRRFHSPVLSASKAIKLAAALVSILALETAMLAQFGEESEEQFRLIMTGLTGCGVCLIVLTTAIVMLFQSAKQLKSLKNDMEMERFQ